MTRSLFLSVLALMAIACTPVPVHWQKAGADGDQWNRDRALCHSRARKEAGRRYGEAASEAGSPVYGSGQTLEKSMARYDAQKDQRRLYERCLKARGYRRTSVVPAK